MNDGAELFRRRPSGSETLRVRAHYRLLIGESLVHALDKSGKPCDGVPTARGDDPERKRLFTYERQYLSRSEHEVDRPAYTHGDRPAMTRAELERR